jgi:hypothetical protein
LAAIIPEERNVAGRNEWLEARLERLEKLIAEKRG